MSFTKEQLREQMLLYAVTDRHWLNGQTLYEQVEEALKGGATFIQLREKDLTEEEFLEEAKKIQQLCKKYRVPFIINDNVKLAKEIDADGVHVGQSDMEALDVRAQLGEDKIIGVSARTVEQALLAEKHGADYLGVGAVFPMYRVTVHRAAVQMMLKTHLMKTVLAQSSIQAVVLCAHGKNRALPRMILQRLLTTRRFVCVTKLSVA